MKKFFLALIMSLLVTSTGNAEIKTIDIAKQKAERAAQEGTLPFALTTEKISAEVATEDKIFQANQKFEAAQKNFYSRNYEAIELNPNFAQAYFARGKCYQLVGNMA